MRETVDIRLQLLRDIGAGLSKRETVKHLTEKFGITTSGAYYHFETRSKWLPQYANFDRDFAFQVKQRFNYIYREACFQYLHSQNDNAKIGYLRTMLEANSKCAEFLPEDAKDEKPDGYILTWQEPEWMKKYRNIEEILKEYESVVGEVASRYTLDMDRLTPEEKEVMDQAARIYIKYNQTEKETIH